MLIVRTAVSALVLLVAVGVPLPASADGKCFSDPADDIIGTPPTPLDMVEICHGNTADKITYVLRMKEGFEDPPQAEIAFFMNLRGDESQFEAAAAIAFFQGQTRAGVFANPETGPGTPLQPQAARAAAAPAGIAAQPQPATQPVQVAVEPEGRPTEGPAAVQAPQPPHPPGAAAQLDPESLAQWQAALRAAGLAWAIPQLGGSDPTSWMWNSGHLDPAVLEALAAEVPAQQPQPVETRAEPPVETRAEPPVVAAAPPAKAAVPAAVEPQAAPPADAPLAQAPSPPPIQGTDAQVTHEPGSDTITLTFNSGPLEAFGLGSEGRRYEYVVGTTNGQGQDKAPESGLLFHDITSPGEVPGRGQAQAPPTAAPGATPPTGGAGNDDLPRNGEYIETYLRVALALLAGGLTALGIEFRTRWRWRSSGPSWEAPVFERAGPSAPLPAPLPPSPWPQFRPALPPARLAPSPSCAVKTHPAARPKWLTGGCCTTRKDSVRPGMFASPASVRLRRESLRSGSPVQFKGGRRAPRYGGAHRRVYGRRI